MIDTQTKAGEPPSSGLADWLQLARNMIDAGVAVAAAARAYDRNGPQITGLALLFRSVGHMRAVVLLINAGLVVEARTITRNMLENLFLAVALKEDGAGTVKKMMAHHNYGRKKLGKHVTEAPDMFSAEQIAIVEAHLKTLEKGKPLTPSEASEGTEAGKAYPFYSQLSGDSAHATFDALNRHVVEDEAGKLVELSFEPVPVPGEPRDTLGYACWALFGILDAVCALTDATEAKGQIDAVGARYHELVHQLEE